MLFYLVAYVSEPVEHIFKQRFPVLPYPVSVLGQPLENWHSDRRIDVRKRYKYFGFAYLVGDLPADIVEALLVPYLKTVQIDGKHFFIIPLLYKIVYVLPLLAHVFGLFGILAFAIYKPYPLVYLAANQIAYLLVFRKTLQKEQNGLVEKGFLHHVAHNSHLFDIQMGV